MSDLSCWNCGADASDEPLPLSRQASCQKCGEYLHCCRQCTQCAPNRPGECNHDLTDPPFDKTSANFCEYFKPNFRLDAKSNNEDAKAKLDALFDEVDDDVDAEPKTKSGNPLDDLFDD